MNLDTIERFKALLKKDNTRTSDLETKALFYILANNTDLFNKANFIYDFKGHMIKPECLTDGTVDFSSGARKLVVLGYNLYNNFCNLSVLDIFSSLDEENFNLALDAIKIRFNKSLI